MRYEPEYIEKKLYDALNEYIERKILLDYQDLVVLDVLNEVNVFGKPIVVRDKFTEETINKLYQKYGKTNETFLIDFPMAPQMIKTILKSLWKTHDFYSKMKHTIETEEFSKNSQERKNCDTILKEKMIESGYIPFDKDNPFRQEIKVFGYKLEHVSSYINFIEDDFDMSKYNFLRLEVFFG